MPKIASKIEPTFEGDVLDHDRVRGLAAALDAKPSLVPIQSSIYSHAILDGGRNILALIERATGRWKLALALDSVASADDRTSNNIPQTPAGVEAQIAVKLSENFGTLGVRAMKHSRFSHALVDDARNILALVEKATGKWLLALSDDTVISPQAILGDARFGVQDPARSGFILPVRDTAGNLLGGWRRDGRLLASLADDSIIPAGAVNAAVRSLLASTGMGLVSGRLFFSGDSLTAGAGGNGVSYPAIMAAALGLPFITTAVGGTRSGSIGVRQGGIPMNLTLAASLPADTSEIDVTTYSEEYTNNQGSQSINAMLNGIPVVLRRYGVSGDEVVTQKYTVRRRSASGEAVAIPASTRCIPDITTGNELDFHYIQAGQNDPKGTRAERIVIRDNILRMVDRIGHDRFGFIALKPVGLGEVTGTGGYDRKMETNQLIEQAIGRHSVRTYEYLSSAGALLDAGITATSDDNTAIAGGAIPPSLLFDGLHGNAAYYTLEGNFMARWHRGQGW